MYVSNQFNELCKEKTIFKQLTIPSTLQQNGVAERRNRTFLKIVKSMMIQTNLFIYFWEDVLLTPTYILNLVSSKYVTFTPYKLWIGKRLELNHLRPQWSAGYVYDPSPKHDKLGPHGKKYIFIRYPKCSKGYAFISENTDGNISKLESPDVTFIENDFPSRGELQKDFYHLEIDDFDTGSHKLSENIRDLSWSVSNNALQDMNLCHRECGNITCQQFEIEGNDVFRR